MDTPESATSSPAPDAEAFDAARAALARLRGQGRGPDGRVLPGNTCALKSGERSARLWTEPDVDVWVRERTEAIRSELGAHVSQVRGSLVDTFARLELIEASLADNLFQHGPLTGKGRTRAALSAWLSVADRKARIAQQIGLERMPQATQTVRDYLGGGAS